MTTSVITELPDEPWPDLAEAVTAGGVWVAGQTVVYTAIVSVVTEPILPGQSATVGGQAVIVYVVVAYTVLVVQDAGSPSLELP